MRGSQLCETPSSVIAQLTCDFANGTYCDYRPQSRQNWTFAVTDDERVILELSPSSSVGYLSSRELLIEAPICIYLNYRISGQGDLGISVVQRDGDDELTLFLDTTSGSWTTAYFSVATTLRDSRIIYKAWKSRLNQLVGIAAITAAPGTCTHEVV